MGNHSKGHRFENQIEFLELKTTLTKLQHDFFDQNRVIKIENDLPSEAEWLLVWTLFRVCLWLMEESFRGAEVTKELRGEEGGWLFM